MEKEEIKFYIPIKEVQEDEENFYLILEDGNDSTS